jgi:hypothetical protein
MQHQRPTEQKSVSARGGRLRRFGDLPAERPANVQLKRRHAASDNKTSIPARIFPNAGLLYSKTRYDRDFFVRDVLPAFVKLAASLELKTAHPRIFDCLTQSFQFGINEA